MSESSFFVGYLPIPKPLRVLLGAVAVGTVAFFAAFAFVVGATQDNPGDGQLRFDLGRQTVSGVLELNPYPVLHVTEGSENVSVGETLMMSGAGKFGVIEQAEKIGPTGATVSGIILNRGSIRMLQIPNRNRDIKAADVAASPPEAVDLGRWRLAGEICDGKCLTGAMRPGRGLAHKACAELCILGGVPPVFVTTQPVEGHAFLMIGAANGGPISPALLARTGVYISVEGRVEQRGGLAVFLADEATVEVLP
ncbi:MAG: hypothetical protein V2I76_03250 [Roseobacter sp.]|jgi:hypothetical protein|nr:hypothetical protein [Roseobacter sp.]